MTKKECVFGSRTSPKPSTRRERTRRGLARSIGGQHTHESFDFHHASHIVVCDTRKLCGACGELSFTKSKYCRSEPGQNRGLAIFRLNHFPGTMQDLEAQRRAPCPRPHILQSRGEPAPLPARLSSMFRVLLRSARAMSRRCKIRISCETQLML